MNKTKKTYFLISVFVFSAISLAAVSQQALAYGGATVSWEAPELDEGGGNLTGLDGYRVYYSSSEIDCAGWDAADSAARLADEGTLLPEAYVDVSGGATLSYTFSNTLFLTPGTTYNFAVVAYDDASPVNLSKCAVTSGSATYVSKAVTYSADTDNNFNVNYIDYGTFHSNYHTNTSGGSSTGDFDRSGYVDYLDYGILHNDYNQCFSTGC